MMRSAAFSALKGVLMTQPESALERTPLPAVHLKAGARMASFGGWAGGAEARPRRAKKG